MLFEWVPRVSMLGLRTGGGPQSDSRFSIPAGGTLTNPHQGGLIWVPPPVGHGPQQRSEKRNSMSSGYHILDDENSLFEA